MTDTVPPEAATRDRLVIVAAQLFRQKGYAATGLSEVLAAAGVPKGSLYHHFPEGKADLARAAADWTAEVLLRIVRDAFAGATSWQGGVTTLFYKMAKLFDLSATADTCPISALLFDGPEGAAFRDHAAGLFDRLIEGLAAYAERHGRSDPQSDAETVLIALEGSWTLARSRRQSDVLRRMPARLFG
jgi:TetR/AcrR family transcriptional regulator, lmrAB and yxaGH operons repressor